MEIDEVSATLGKHGAKLETIDQKVDRMAAAVEQLVAEKNERKGARRTMLTAASALGGIAGAAASAVAAVLTKH